MRWLALGLGAVLALLMGWGYWFSATHAALDIGISDVAGRIPDRATHGASLDLLDEAGSLLARTRSVEPWGYQLAQHPGFGDCTRLEGLGGSALRNASPTTRRGPPAGPRARATPR